MLAVTTFKTMEEALELANDTQYGLGAGVWSRNGNLAYKMGRGIQAGRVWTNCYHAYPAHAAFGGYKQSGIGRETHKMMLEHYQQNQVPAGEATRINRWGCSDVKGCPACIAGHYQVWLLPVIGIGPMLTQVVLIQQFVLHRRGCGASWRENRPI